MISVSFSQPARAMSFPLETMVNRFFDSPSSPPLVAATGRRFCITSAVFFAPTVTQPRSICGAGGAFDFLSGLGFFAPISRVADREDAGSSEADDPALAD